MENKENNIILLKNLLERGVHIEQVSDFNNSIFGRVYEGARQSVQRIVWDNRSRQDYIQKRTRQSEIGVSNVISFIGRRGTGKSSAMLSFSAALNIYKKKNMYLHYDNIEFNKESEMEDVRFFSLDYIDASILEESEDIFILVLANMLNYLESLNKSDRHEANNGYRDLLHKFEKVYEDFLTVKGSTKSVNEVYSSFEQLKNVAGSQRIRVQFYKLVEEFLDYVRRTTQSEAKECYLVISIDDLDMAYYNTQNKIKADGNNKSYEIVNNINKYLSIPGVIVLTAYNHVNLMSQSENFFINCHKTNYFTEENRISQIKVSSKLANQFIDKVFAPAYRIYLPSWKKRDYQSTSFRIDVDTGIDAEKNLFETYCTNNRRFLTIKEFMLILYGEKVGVYYDCEGTKVHFLEPDSLRTLSDTIELFEDEKLHLTEKIDSSADNIEYRKKVFKRIKDDIYFRFIQEKLCLPNERELFNQLMELRIDRRSQTLVSIISKKTKPLGKSFRKFERDLRLQLENANYQSKIAIDQFYKEDYIVNKMNSNVEYSFAELVHSIYHMTRGESGFSKELVACILHSYSIYLSELYDEYRMLKAEISNDEWIQEYRYNGQNSNNSRKFKKIEEIHEIFKGVIGKSICGRWCEYFFPGVSASMPGLSETLNVLIFGYTRINSAEEYKFMTKNEPTDLEETVKSIILFSILFVDVLNWECLPLSFVPKKDEVEVHIKTKAPQDIEMTAFMKYAFMYPEFLNHMEKLLTEAVSLQEQENKLIGKDFFDQFKIAVANVFEAYWKEFVNWDKKYGNMVVPIHNFDCTYNLIKHIFLETYKNDDVVEIKNGQDFYKEVSKMNSRFLNHLKEIDTFYGKTQVDKRLETVFSECPFVKLTEDTSKNIDNLAENMSETIKALITSLVAGKNIRLSIDESQRSGN
jgi:hypothetical protein